MADHHSPQHDADLVRFWDAVIRGDRDPDTGTLDTGDIAFVRQMHELAHAQTPAGARARGRAAAYEARAAQRAELNGKGTGVATRIPLAGMVSPAGTTTTQQYSGSTGRRGTHRFAAFGGAAAIAIVMLLSLFIFYQSNDNYGAIPPIQGEATPDATPNAGFTDDYFEFVWASSPTGREALSHPLTIRLSPDNKLWVADVTGRWFIFDTDGNLEEIWGSGGREPGQFNFRHDYGNGNVGEVAFIAFAGDGSFYVADTFNYRVQHFDAARNFVGSWGSQGSGDGQFLLPASITLEGDGTVLVTDVERGDIQRFTEDGTFISVFDASGSANSQLVTPLVAAIGPSGNMYVVEGEANRVRVFDPKGTQLFTFGLNSGNFDGLRIPTDIAIDARGTVYIVDSEMSRVVLFDADGNYLHDFGQPGTGDGEFGRTGGIALGTDGALYVVDWEGNRIQKFQLTRPLPGGATPDSTPTS